MVFVKVGEFRFERVGEFSFIKKNTCMSFETSLWMTVACGWLHFDEWVGGGGLSLKSGSLLRKVGESIIVLYYSLQS